MIMIPFPRRARPLAAWLVLILLLAACAGSRPAASDVDESGNAGPVPPQAEDSANAGGYTSKVSVAQGESLDFHLSSDTGQSATLRIYREGPTRQLMTTLENVPVDKYSCTGKYATGCDWPVAMSFTVPKDWPSGAYVTTVTPAGSTKAREFIFWVREDNPGSTARLLFLSSVNTHQAYNDFGGGSLYGFGNTEKGDRVSFDRPYSGGTGKYGRWEAVAIPWLESNGYKAEYATTYDLQFHPDLLSHYDVVMIVGHSEYWTWDARRQVEQFVNHGGRFLSLAGNVMWWQVRYEDNGRTMVGYKKWKDDPEKAANLSTDNPGEYPILDNPLGLTGLYWPYGGYPGNNGDGYYAVHTNHWIFEGTGVKENQLIGKGPTADSSIHDKESDGMPFNCDADGSSILGAPGSAGTPGNFTVLGLTTVYSKQRDLDDFTMMGLYTRPGGGALFAAGTTGWASGLGDPVIDRMTRNLLDRFLAGNVPAEPDNPDADYFIYNRFNCYDVNRGRFASTSWQDDIARNNFVEWQGNATGRLTLACGYSGSGLEFKPGGGTSTTRYTLAVRPNWATTNTLYSHFYLKLDGLGLADGKVFNLAEQSADDRHTTPAAAMVLQVRRSGNAYQMRYQPADADMAWVVVPGDRFFLVETGWNRNTGRVGLWIDGVGYDEPANLSSMPALNRFDLGVMRPTGGVGGAYCLDELILDGKRFGGPDEPTPTATAEATATNTPTTTATPTITATPTTTATPSPTPTGTWSSPTPTNTATPTTTATATRPGDPTATATATGVIPTPGPDATRLYLPFVTGN